MNRKLYERECLIRRPQFRRDLEKLFEESPGVREIYAWRWRSGRGVRRAGEGPDKVEMEAHEEFLRKYPLFNDMDAIRLIQSYPLVFDPVWHVAVDQAITRLLGRKGWSIPRGLVTRLGVEEDGPNNFPELEEVYQVAREIFVAMDERIKGGWRQMLGEPVFRGARIFLPITQDTTLEEVQRVWPRVKHAQKACFGAPSNRRTPRRYLYEGRLRAWDLVRVERLPTRVAIERSGMQPRTFWRRYSEARRDIGVEATGQRMDSDGFAAHLVACRSCQEAERSGKSDMMCAWMQRQLGPRGGRSIRGQLPIEAEENVRKGRWRP